MKSRLEEKPSGKYAITKPVYSKFFMMFLERYKLSKLRKSIRYAYGNSPFYHRLFKENNLRPSDIRSFKDMVKIPFTTPEDLVENPKDFFSVPF